MPSNRVEDRLRPITPQLAWRVAVLGGIAFVLFGIVFFRLWYLQVLTGDTARVAASQNGRRTERIEAPRGDIVDRHANQLVRTKKAAVVQLVPSSLPERVLEDADNYRKALGEAESQRLAYERQYEALSRQLKDDGRKSTKAEERERRRLRKLGSTARKVPIPPIPTDEPGLTTLYRRISETIDIRPKTIHERVIRSIADTPYSNVTVRTDVPLAQFNYMRERPEYFKGVVVTKRYIREYPEGKLAAQLFGTVSEIGTEQMKLRRYKDVAQGTRIGQTGLEYSYDEYLRGRDGYTRLVVDAHGSRDDERKVSVVEPKQGQRLRLTIDMDLQRTGEQALAQAIQNSEYETRAGAFVAMDPRNGEVLAMGSAPSFDANWFAKPFTQQRYEYLTSNETDAPLLNRATESAYPSASTFKPVTALAALEEGLITPSRKINDPGHWEYGGREYQNAKEAVFGSINVGEALKVSSDIFFFKLGAQANDKGPIIQKWAERLGYGRKTGIDLPNEAAGLVPDSKWRNEAYAEYERCVEKNGLELRTTAALFECGGIERTWTGGDNVNLAVGQGDLQATPLQVAVAYAAFANGGTIVRPHLGKAVENANGVPLQEFRPKAKRKVKIPSRDRQVILEGLRSAAQGEGGTSADVWQGWPMDEFPVYGKTGTAERQPNPDQAWYACFVKDKGRPIVVVVTVEKGGFGAATAAPAARMMLSEWFDVSDREFHAGTSVTR
ncbi:penicillin-binding protein 2 [Solirubrobacter sp. CPCC 204708]|uniref:Penicillin-binding protein 2 n=1 Tax=Solirubrobacter deserti TaxID=2282478 RepID=A0ABT4RVV7_9ACTN|nr:penicillin-binding protein 2 [Solirubrobacter deserti]MBE2316239.1 penicillin-binding protein 2 [Solirubrobacter deserti]MDA0142375.1 penicillin-binding protein 2 [Solirubrobacter deserti]